MQRRVSRCLLGRGFRVKKYAATILTREYALHGINWHCDFPRDTIETRRKLNQFVTNREIARGLLAHRQDDLTVFYIFLRHARVLIPTAMQLCRRMKW